MATFSEIEQHRGYLFSIAYRMLGSISDAEDMVQECFLRWHRLEEPDEILSPRSYLSTMVTRLCVEHLRKAHVRRETYVGPWLPEPLVTSEEVTSLLGRRDGDATHRHEQLEQISVAFLLMLERLSPVERAAFLLRKAFDYNYSEIAAVIEKTESHCRQLVRRAQQHIDEGDELASRRARGASDPETQMQIMSAFLTSCSSGDLAGLVSLLADDAVFTSDSNGKAHAARRPVYGAERVARLALGLMRKSPPHLTMQIMTLNGSPAIVLYDGPKAQSSTIFEIGEGRVTAIYTTVNPDKLRHLDHVAEQSEAAELQG